MYAAIVLQAATVSLYIVWRVKKDKLFIVIAQSVSILSILVDYSLAMAASSKLN